MSGWFLSKFYWPQAPQAPMAASSALATLAIPVASCCRRFHGDGDDGGAGDASGAGGATTKELAVRLIEVKFGLYHITN